MMCWVIYSDRKSVYGNCDRNLPVYTLREDFCPAELISGKSLEQSGESWKSLL